MFVDQSVGAAITMFMQGTQKERPLTHDLLANVLRALGAKIDREWSGDLDDSRVPSKLPNRSLAFPLPPLTSGKNTQPNSAHRHPEVPGRSEPTFLDGNPGFRNAFLSCLGVSTRPQSRTLAPREETTARRSLKSYAKPA